MSSNTVSMFTSKGRFLGYIGDSDGSSFKALGSSYPTRQVDCTSVTTMEWSPTNNSDWNIHCVIVFTLFCCSSNPHLKICFHKFHNNYMFQDNCFECWSMV